MGYDLQEFSDLDLSIAFTTETEEALTVHFEKEDIQEDLTFAYWLPSHGAERYTAILSKLALPAADERVLQGNVAFTAEYLGRILDECPEGFGIALLHSHLGPGWQSMSEDDVVAERDRLAGVVAGRTNLPLVGLTWATDGEWSGRFWLRAGRRDYQRQWAATVRSVGDKLRISYHPKLRPAPVPQATQVATRSVWGDKAQQDLVRARVGIIGLGSVGSIVAEALSRMGMQQLTLIDYDTIEERNLDRTLGAYRQDVSDHTLKVEVSRRLVEQSHTAKDFRVRALADSILQPTGLAAALGCDVIISCVDRPQPRELLNRMAYLHLIPVIDGGILARVTENGTLAHVDWRIHTVGPGHACLFCIGALLRSDVVLDRDGQLDSPDYVQGLTRAERERYERRNVFGFSLSVASHQTLQLVGLITGSKRVGGIGAQRYRGYPGVMEVTPNPQCNDDCDVPPLMGSAIKLL